MAILDQLAERFAGRRIPGGCDHCDAYQTLDPSRAPIFRLNVHHDDWCPWLAQREAS